MPFEKGKSGNPTGGFRNAKKFYDAINRRLSEDPQKLDKIAQGLIDEAEKREPWAVKELADRLDGKPVQAQIVSGDDDAPLQMQFDVSKLSKAAMREILNAAVDKS